ncbi:MAG: tripartite tricarboxylate transporter substrate binding protein [Burkholderiales bacterium]|nr:tripartite tricarboxylate transporter substrate binding protein [Burkholderiales bacterium]
MKRMLAALCLMVALAAHAQEPYPNRAVKFVVPFTPGTGIDILARTLGQKLADDWKVPVVVDNRPGASGAIGTDAVIKAPPDGYTLLMSAVSLVQNVSLAAVPPYDPVRDLVAVAPLAIGSFALVAHPSVPAKSVKELVALAKASPGKLNYASPGNGTPHHLAMELFKARTGVAIVHVPYKGTAQAVQDLVGGQVQVAFLPVHVALPQVEAGRLVMLASGGAARTDVTPNVPSLAEAAGVGDVVADIWYGLYAPAGTAQPVVERLNAEVNRVLENPEVVRTLARQGLTPTGGTSVEFARFTKSELQRWTAVVRTQKIRAD